MFHGFLKTTRVFVFLAVCLVSSSWVGVISAQSSSEEHQPGGERSNFPAPSSAEAYTQATDLLYRAQEAESLEVKTDHWLQVVDIYTDMLEDYPEEETLLINRGATYMQLGQYEKAIHDFGEVVSLNPQSASGLRNRALALEITDNLEAARTDYVSLLHIMKKYKAWETMRPEEIVELEEHVQELSDRLRRQESETDILQPTEGLLGDPRSLPAMPASVRTYSWLGNLKMHNAVIDGVQYDNLDGWMCGAWYSNVSNVENIVYFSIFNTAWNHRAYILVLGHWDQVTWDL